jgi:pimeloyl-ACP methyl ester carboxylesterase
MLDDIGRNLTISIEWKGNSLPISYIDCGEGEIFLYLHGWGQSHAAFLPIIESLSGKGRHIAIDLPGFGNSPVPPEAWAPQDYAALINKFLKKIMVNSCFVVGHSYGGRVAFWLAVENPAVIEGLFLIASAGLKTKLPFSRQLRISAIRTLARLSRRYLPFIGQRIKDYLYSKIASRDYQPSGVMRPILIKAVNDDVSEILPQINNPVLLLYGENDVETPPKLGQSMNKLLPDSEYIELPGFDHHSILNRGRHQTVHQLTTFAGKLHRNQ